MTALPTSYSNRIVGQDFRRFNRKSAIKLELQTGAVEKKCSRIAATENDDQMNRRQVALKMQRAQKPCGSSIHPPSHRLSPVYVVHYRPAIMAQFWDEGHNSSTGWMDTVRGAPACVVFSAPESPHFTQQASFVALFSEGHIGSPVSTIPPGKCNAITNRSFGESRVDFFV
jgi:hypothetical protein